MKRTALFGLAVVFFAGLLNGCGQPQATLATAETTEVVTAPTPPDPDSLPFMDTVSTKVNGHVIKEVAQGSSRWAFDSVSHLFIDGVEVTNQLKNEKRGSENSAIIVASGDLLVVKHTYSDPQPGNGTSAISLWDMKAKKIVGFVSAPGLGEFKGDDRPLKFRWNEVLLIPFSANQAAAVRFDNRKISSVTLKEESKPYPYDFSDSYEQNGALVTIKGASYKGYDSEEGMTQGNAHPWTRTIDLSKM